MRGLSATVVGAFVVLVCTTSALLARVWVLRNSFDMAARNPVLLVCIGSTTLVLVVLVLLHWFLLLEEQGQGLPCFVTFAATYFWYAFGIVPFILRAVRIVVVYHSSYRYKYAGLVKWRNLRKAWASGSLSIVGLAAILFAGSARHYRNDYGCAFFGETAVLGAMLLISAPGLGFLVYKLSRVNDAFKLRREFFCALLVAVPLTCACMLLQTLFKTGAIAETRAVHLIMEAMTLVIHLNVLFWQLVVSVAMHDGWCGCGVSRIAPTEDYSASTRLRSSGPIRDGVLAYVEEGGEVASMFEHFCTRSLCAESWDFVFAACKYEAISGVEEQFNSFVHITEQYLKPSSPQEVNISHQMQAEIALLQDKNTFSALDGYSRRDVLQDPKKEIVRMLEHNLLAKFTQSPGMLKWRERAKLQSLLLKQADSAAAEGDENMRTQLLRCSDFLPEDDGVE